MSAPSPYEQSQQTQSTESDTQLWLLRAAKGVVIFVYIWVLVNLVLLTLGFFLRLLGASTDAAFTRWVYRNVDRVMDPFRGMFPDREISDVSVLDASLLFAMIVYIMLGIGVHALVSWLTGKIVALRRRQEREQEQNRQLAAAVQRQEYIAARGQHSIAQSQPYPAQGQQPPVQQPPGAQVPRQPMGPPPGQQP